MLKKSEENYILKKCDRCGTIYEQETIIDTEYLNITNNKIGFGHHGNQTIVVNFDLCLSCQKQLVEWFNKKKE